MPILKRHMRCDVWKGLLSVSRSQNDKSCADSVRSQWGKGVTIMVRQEGALPFGVWGRGVRGVAGL